MRRLFLVSLLLISGLFFTFSLASLSRQSAEAGSNLPHLVNPSSSLSPSPLVSLSSPIFPSLRVKQAPTSGQALSRRAPSINGRLEGSIQQLTPENVTLNGGATITEKLYVPGTPTVRRNGNPNFGGVIEGSGSAIPTNYQVTLNGNATLGNLVNRTNPVALTPVAVSPTPTGTRDVSLNNPNDQIGDFATLRNLTLNGNAGTRSIPPGTYGNFTVNGSSVLIFGIANATEPAVYNLQGLTLNGGTQLQIVGPVTLTLRNGTNINGSIGNAANPQWLTLNVSNGGVTLNGGSQMFGKVNAPAGSVTVNSRLTGNVVCDRLTVNGGGVVTILAQAPQDTTAPVITIAEPLQGLITKTSPITVSGTVTDTSAVTVTVNGQPVTLSGTQFTASVTLAEGSNTITVLATDAFGNVGTASRNVTLDTTAPVLTVISPQDGAVTTETQLTITGTVTDATTTTVTVNNVAVTRNGNEFSAIVSLVEGPNTFVVRAEDAAGNQTEITRTVTLQVQQDTTPPVITLTEPTEGLITNTSPVTVSGTVTDASAVTVTVNSQPATLSGTEFTANVTLTEGSNTITVSAIDAFGNTSSVSRTVVLDTIAPVLTVTSPEDGAFTTEEQITVTGTVTDATTISVTVNDIAATLTGNEFSAIVPLVEGLNNLLIQAIDEGSNSSTRNVTITRSSTPLTVTLTEPADGVLTNAQSITVSGLVSGQASQVTVNGNPVSLAGDGTFSTQIPLTVEGENPVTVRASNSTQEATVTQSVRRDTTPPVLTVEEPVDNFVSEVTTVNLSGLTTDLYGAQVTIDGQALGQDHNRFYGSLDLLEGVHQIAFVATDPAGNTAEVVRTVTIDLTSPALVQISPENNVQITGTTVEIQGQIADSTRVVLEINEIPITTDASGNFSVTLPINEGTNDFQLDMTDAAGNQSSFDLTITGKDTTPPNLPVAFPVQSPTRLTVQTIEGIGEPGSQIRISGNGQQVIARAAIGTGLFVANVNLLPGTNFFTLVSQDVAGNTSAESQISIHRDPNLPFPALGQPSRISAGTGDTQRGLSGTEFPRPFVAVVTDVAGNRIAGVPVEFRIRFGDGQFIGGGNTVTEVSNEQGYAVARCVAGPSTGVQFIHASFAGNVETPAVFTPEVLRSVPGEPTRVSGVVLDQNLRSLPNVLIRLNGQQARTGVNGRFELTQVPSGPHQLLEVIGRDQVPLPGRWPNISFDIDVLPGVNNHLGRPLFLPRVNEGVELPLNENNIVTQDTVYSMPVTGGEPPIQVTVKAGTTVTFPPDISDRRFSVTRISASRIPMSLEDGRATNLYISVQPSGTLFDPPLAVTFPNSDHQPPNTQVLLMSFDHDAGRYVKAGTARVSGDGETVTSEPGSGIRIGAWHGVPPDPPGPQVTVLGNIQVEGNPEFDAKVVVDAEAWVEGTRAVMLIDGVEVPPNRESTNSRKELLREEESPREAMIREASRIDFRATLTISVANPLKELLMECFPEIKIPKTKMFLVKLNGGDTILSDLGKEYKGKDDFNWIDENGDGTPEFNYPIAYQSGQSLKTELEFKLDPAPKDVTNAKLRAILPKVGNVEYKMPEMSLEYKKDKKVLKSKAEGVATPFPPLTVNFFDPLEIKWEISLDGKTNWDEIGISQHRIYVTFEKPEGKLFETLVHIGCKNAVGAKSKDEAVAKIWADFSNRIVRTYGTSVAPSKRLSYWAPMLSGNDPKNPDPPTEYFTTEGLLKNGDGRCGAWQAFFRDCLRLQGIDSQYYDIEPRRSHGNENYLTYGVAGIITKPIPAQGNDSPHSNFTNHAMIEYNKMIYDPSYGGNPYNSLIDWEITSLDFVYYAKDRSDLNPKIVHEDKTTEETKRVYLIRTRKALKVVEVIK